jgi:cation-transporting P-type ATPase J
MARQRYAARLAISSRATLAAAAAAAGSGDSLPGAAASSAARSMRPSPSAPMAPNPAIAAASGARRGLAGSHRLSRPVTAMPAALAVTATATATSWMPAPRPAGGVVHCRNVAMRMAGWLATAVASQSRPTSGPETSSTIATRRAWLAAISGRNPSATSPDRMRPAAAAAVARITAVTGAAPLLLTGDNQRAASRLAAQAGITDTRAGCSRRTRSGPCALQAGGQRVLLVGDGVNDAPALAAAHTGAAMGRAGSDLALDTAGAVIMRDDLATVPAVIALSRRARRVVTANLAIAAAIITALVTWDLAGHLPLPLGVLGHEGSTVIVGLNGLRLLRKSAWTKALRD